MGASVGTTLSMQLISFRLTEYAFVAIALGFICQAVVPQLMVKNLGRAVLGFGLLFLGLDFLSGTIEPYRAELAPWLERIDGTTWAGLGLGILVALVVTGIIQSSGAVIGMLFALISAGVFTELGQVFPIILGAHIGTAGTALLVSIGTNLEARRAAFGNLLFQLFNVALALALAPLLLGVVGMVGGDLVRQTANLHTVVMAAAVLVLLPILPFYVKAIYRLTPSRTAAAETSFLEPELIRNPEKAIVATLSELGRVVAVCRESFRVIREQLEQGERVRGQKVKLNEAIVNEVRGAVKSYLATLARGYLSRRQALMVQYLDRCMSDIERIGDHIAKLLEIRRRQQRSVEGEFDPRTAAELSRLLGETEAVLAKLADSLRPETPSFGEAGQALLRARDHYEEESYQAKAAVNERVARHELHPLTGLYFSEYISALDRIVKHCKMIAREQQQPFFRIKGSKINGTTGAP
jgi:phosphate:Na+ symporter